MQPVIRKIIVKKNVKIVTTFLNIEMLQFLFAYFQIAHHSSKTPPFHVTTCGVCI